MAKKKRAMKTEVIGEDGDVNLTGTTRLDFSLNKTDVVEYFISDLEEELEKDIEEAIKVVNEAEVEASELGAAFKAYVEKVLANEFKNEIKTAKRAVLKLGTLGFSPRAGHGVHVTVSNEPRRIYISSRRSDPEDAISIAKRTSNGYVMKTIGRKVSPTIWNHEDYQVAAALFSDVNIIFSLTEGRSDVSSVINVHGVTKYVNLKWDDKMAKIASQHVAKLQDKVAALKKLHGLLQKHDDLPRIKKQIKRQIVGNVLKSTDEGKLLLTALKGIRSKGVNLLMLAPTP